MATRNGILGMGVALMFCASGMGAELLPAKNPERVEISANRMRMTRVAGGDFDDRLQKVQIEVVARNLDYNRPANGLTLHYWVLAESLVDHKEILVIDRGAVPVDLTSTPEGREIRKKGELVALKWDDTGAIFGQRYRGWILILVNARNEVVAVKSNQPNWQSAFQRAMDLKKGSWCGLDLKPLKGSPKN
jgi:hypothetical protein